MDKLLEMATIKINLKLLGNYLAQASLNWGGVFEVRFFRISLSALSLIYLQPPATGLGGNNTWFKCFIVKDLDQWHELQKKVIGRFFEELEEKVKEGIYAPEVLERLKRSDYTNNQEVLSEEDLDKIDKAISTDTHL